MPVIGSHVSVGTPAHADTEESSADRETRRQFARNPRAFLRQALGEQLDDATIDEVFVETAEYSARVEDVA
jgi:hypothetical protein